MGNVYGPLRTPSTENRPLETMVSRPPLCRRRSGRCCLARALVQRPSAGRRSASIC